MTQNSAINNYISDNHGSFITLISNHGYLHDSKPRLWTFLASMKREFVRCWFPNHDEAWACRHQYMFTNECLVLSAHRIPHKHDLELLFGGACMDIW